MLGAASKRVKRVVARGAGGKPEWLRLDSSPMDRATRLVLLSVFGAGVFLAGLAVFTLASIACGLATSQEMLVAARFVQGVGGALTSAVILGMIVTMFPEPREQAKAIGVYAFVASAGGSVGLLAGGVLTQAINWHWIFFVNIPIGIVTAVLAMRLLEKDKGLGLGKGTDVAGAVLITAALMLLVYTIVDPAAERGWGATQTLVLVDLTPGPGGGRRPSANVRSRGRAGPAGP